MRTVSALPARALGCAVLCAGVLTAGACARVGDGAAVPRSSPAASSAQLAAGSTPTPAQVGTPAPSQRRTFTPTGIRLIDSGPHARVRPMDTDATGHVQLPTDPGEVGWWLGGALAGDPFGSVVLG